MRVYIANFGEGNYEWPACKERGTIATMNDLAAHVLWEAGDRASFITRAMGRKHRRGSYPIRPVASRWFNLMSIIATSEGDIWFHRAKDELWWTVSRPDPPSFEEKTEPFPDKQKVVVCHKPCDPWSDRTRGGRLLRWDALHPRAREFMFTEGTLQQLSVDNAGYAIALLNGDDLAQWENRPDWKSKTVVRPGKGGAVKIFSGRDKAIERMAKQAFDTVAGANGQQVLRTMKEKNVVGFADPASMEPYLRMLLDEQEDLCAITDMKFEMDGEGDPEMRPSLDRIDSGGHYEEGNLQVVCKFVNRWKGNGNDEEFRRLVGIVRSLGAVAPPTLRQTQPQKRPPLG
jgi:hypothetical protein